MHPRAAICRILVIAVAVLGAAGLGWGQAPQDAADSSLALLATIEGPIGPGTAHYVSKAVEAARVREAEILILRLDTPGGLASSMRDIITEILASPSPVAGYVAPPGAHAASAGTYILYATHIAAMAPGTNIGAATPVQIGGGALPGLPSPEGDKRSGAKKSGGNDNHEEGGDRSTEEKAGGQPPDEPMIAKATNDAVALIRSLAEMHGRNADWGEKAVREAASLSARPALEMRVIDIVADDVEALLAQLNGRTVTAGGVERTLATSGLRVEEIEPGFVTRVLSLLSNPNIALILLMIGVYGLIFEFANPGSIGPGIVGVICLVLGFFALNQLPLDLAGLALVGFGIALMVVEAISPSFGVFGIGGLVAFVVGAAMLIDTDAPAYQLSWWTIGGVAAASGAVLILFLGYVWRAYRRPAGGTVEAMLGTEARVLDWSNGRGHVWARSERWSARGQRELAKGQAVKVRDVEGLTLVVDDDIASDATNPDNDGD